ncbi:MAG: HEPN domain-containing protein [Candidatus Hecatellaceae archaeon]
MSFGRFRDWLAEALDDLSAAEILLREGKYGKACFFSHQASEKATKALMIYKFKRYDEIHSVAELLRRIQAPGELVEIGEQLDRYYIPTRYPNAWPSGPPHTHYRRDEAEKAVEAARRIIQYVQDQLN